MRRAVRPALAGPLLLVLGWGCVSGSAPRDHFYRLEARAPSALAAPRLDGTVEVDRLGSDAITGERLILYRHDESSEIDRHTYHQWTDPPPVMLQKELARFLREAGAAKRVVTPSLRITSDYAIGGRVVRLERVVGGSDGHVVVELELAVVARDGELLLLEAYREERPVPGRGVDAAVAAMGDALSAIFERFLADLPER